MTSRIRRYEPGDIDALYDVCVRTAANGHDLTPVIGDPLLPGHLFAGPYVAFEPALAFVVADDEGVGGYIVGTADTPGFETRCELEWFPVLRERYPLGSGAGTVDNRLISLIHDPPRQDQEIVAEYPAHLHIDIVPRVQGQGWGRQLVYQFTEAVRTTGVRGLHFGVSPMNHRALAFYAHVGFDRLRTDDTSVILGCRFGRS